MLYLISAGVLLVGFGVLIKMFIDGVSKVVAEPQIINDAGDVNDEKSWQSFIDVEGYQKIQRDPYEEYGYGWASSTSGDDVDESIYGGSVYDARWG